MNEFIEKLEKHKYDLIEGYPVNLNELIKDGINYKFWARESHVEDCYRIFVKDGTDFAYAEVTRMALDDSLEAIWNELIEILKHFQKKNKS